MFADKDRAVFIFRPGGVYILKKSSLCFQWAITLRVSVIMMLSDIWWFLLISDSSKIGNMNWKMLS